MQMLTKAEARCERHLTDRKFLVYGRREIKFWKHEAARARRRANRTAIKDSLTSM